MNNTILGYTMIVAAVIGTVVITVDDATVIGIMDDSAIPILAGLFAEGVQMIAG